MSPRRQKPDPTPAPVVEDRLDRFHQLVLGGAPPAQILRIAREELGITSQAEVGKYLARVHTEIQSHGERDRKTAYTTAVARVEALFAASLRIQDYKTALAALKELHRLQGI